LSLSESLIRKLEVAFRDSDLGYKLIDYGPLVLSASGDEEYVEPDDRAAVTKEKQNGGKRCWGKFW
jgi:hypothetical protein